MKNKRSRRSHTHLARIAAGGDGQPDIWQRLTRLLIGVFLLGLLILVLSYFMPEVDKQRDADMELAILTKRHDELTERRDAFADEFERLKNNREYFELVARDKLDLQLEGETIYRIDPAPRALAPTAVRID